MYPSHLRFKQTVILGFILCSFTLFGNVIIATETTLSAPSKSTQDRALSDESAQFDNFFMDNALNQALSSEIAQINHFESMLDYFSLLIYNEPAKFKQKESILAYIQSTKLVISHIRQMSQFGLITLIQELNIALSKNLQNAIKTDLWEPLDLGLYIKREPKDELPLPEIEELLNLNQQNLALLESTIERLGLTRSQKAIRNLEDCYNRAKFYVEKNKLQPYLKYTAIGAVLATYLTYHSEFLAQKAPKPLKTSLLSKIFNNPLTRGLKKIVGSAPKFKTPDSTLETHDKIVNSCAQAGIVDTVVSKFLDRNLKYSSIVVNEDELGLLGKIELPFSRMVNTESTPDVLFPGLALGWLSYETVPDSKISELAPYGLYLSTHPTVRMIAITNHLLQITDGTRYRNFKYWAGKYLTGLYNQLRGKSSKDSLTNNPTTTFKDIIGLEHAKNVLEPVIDYIINPEKFERTKLTPAKGYLLVGAPRTGKSHIASAICGEINERQKLLGRPAISNFIPIDSHVITSSNFENIMRYVNSQAPCVVFLDEIDLLCLNRGDGHKENKLLSQVLTHMSGHLPMPGEKDVDNSHKQVIFLAATNNPQNLDSALLQAGRFGTIITFDYPRLESRIEFLMQSLKKRSITTISEEFIVEIAKELEGYSFEDMSLIITGAIQKAASAYMPISEEHIRANIEETIKGIMPQSKPLSEQELDTLASYQAGKALATKLLLPAQHISTVTILPISKKTTAKKHDMPVITPVIEQGGLFTYQNNNLLKLKNAHDLNLECQVLLAGHIAQELMMGNSCYTYRPEDQNAAAEIAKQIALKGEKYENLTKNQQAAIMDQAYEIKNNCNRQVKNLLENNLTKLKQITQSLKTQGHLGEKELDLLLTPATMSEI